MIFFNTLKKKQWEKTFQGKTLPIVFTQTKIIMKNHAMDFFGAQNRSEVNGVVPFLVKLLLAWKSSV